MVAMRYGDLVGYKQLNMHYCCWNTHHCMYTCSKLDSTENLHLETITCGLGLVASAFVVTLLDKQPKSFMRLLLQRQSGASRIIIGQNYHRNEILAHEGQLCHLGASFIQPVPAMGAA